MGSDERAAAAVDVRGLTKQYGGRTVVQGVTLRLCGGEMVGLVGANGGGKTTTLRMLAGLVAPDAGEGQVLGRDVRRPGARGAGYMAQQLGLYPELTVRENLRFRADAHGLKAASAHIAETAAQFGIGEVMDTQFERLSGGWARRVQFAAAMLPRPRPRLLLLDEPTAGLDVSSRRAIWGWLAELTRAGHAVVIATHDLAEAGRCPRILHFEAGRASEATTPAEFAARMGAATLEEAVLARVRP
jgi:ABC-type multidrug transport system ATPase subunit